MGAIAVGAAAITLAGVVTAAPATINGIILLVGANESQRVVNWYASAQTSQVVQLAPTTDLQDGEFPSSATTYAAVVAANTVNGGFNGHAILDSLQENTAYSYRVGGEGAWSATYAFKTRKFDGNFDFLFFGDPQIGSSGNVPKDQAGWEDTLNVAARREPERRAAGLGRRPGRDRQHRVAVDRVPGARRAAPVPVGRHHRQPRRRRQGLRAAPLDAEHRPLALVSTSATGANRSGGDYWFIYKDVLFIDLNSNAIDQRPAGVDADAAHIGYITDVVKQHGAEAKYTVLVYHHSIYSPADHANDGDNQERRLDFPTAFSNSASTSSCRVTTTATRAAT